MSGMNTQFIFSKLQIKLWACNERDWANGMKAQHDLGQINS